MTLRSVKTERLLDLFVKHLSSEHHWTLGKIESALKQPEEPMSVPLTVFSNRNLGSFEALVKFLHERKLLGFSEIARILNRDPRTIWNSYHSSKKKMPGLLEPEPSNYHLPILIFSERRLSVLESIVHFLNVSSHLGYAQISRLMNRDPRTIHTVKNRIANKLKND